MSAQSQPTPDPADLESWRMLASENLALQFEQMMRMMETRWVRWESAWAADAALPVSYLNSATLLRSLAQEEAGNLVARLDQFYSEETGAPWLLWSAWPTPDLASYGMQPAGETPLMVRLPGPAPSANGLRIVEIGDEMGLRDYDDVMIHGYPIPELHCSEDRISSERGLGGPMRFFVGYEGEKPVACSAACIGERELGIYSVATLPDRRGKGYGRALTVAALASARHLPAVLEASNLGVSIYRSLGFVQIGVFTLWYKPRSPVRP